MKLIPYLHFAGNAREVLNFYKNVLGGDIVQLGTYGESPIPSDEDYKDKVMHARFVFDGNMIMVSDVFKGQPVSTNGNIQLSVDVDNESKLDEVFNKMAEGGKVTMPLADQFWGAKFGMLQDKFGVTWMFNCEKK
ncbi:VOC family protein [Ginsengibacter hankyongi]|uniref:VOC family protein n=1 Tax=Ginsengibacter hankyongi TaxID=2607284 RepID=A0A5J5IG47_9BACT|nr:VOC family protein [Ginsengibacter hankyongi]KAA9039135.1 VOC family protein [Ginsengibacter hankyongi]